MVNDRASLSGSSVLTSAGGVTRILDQYARIGMITGNQIKAARALLDWTQDELASTAGVTSRTVRSLEADAHRPFDRTFSKLQTALEEAGIIFLESDAGIGVMLAMQPSSR